MIKMASRIIRTNMDFLTNDVGTTGDLLGKKVEIRSKNVRTYSKSMFFNPDNSDPILKGV